MGPHHWSTNPEENQTSDPLGYVQKNWPAKSMGPAVRGLMATAARARDDNLGTLVATIGPNNVYTVNTNEGLIDPATQINGLTPAITKPFLIRVVLPAMNTPVATVKPTIVIDGAAPVPLRRRDYGDLADGELFGLPVEILGGSVTNGAYSLARILDPLRSDILGLVAPNKLVVTSRFTPNIVLGDIAGANSPYVTQSLTISGASFARLSSRVGIKNTQNTYCGIISQINSSAGGSSTYSGITLINGIQVVIPIEWVLTGLNRAQSYTFTQICQKDTATGPIQAFDAFLMAEHDGN